MTDAQGWALLGLVGVLISVTVGSVGNQMRLLRDSLESRFAGVDARFTGLESTFEARFDGLQSTFDARFNGLESSFDARFNGLESSIDARFAAVNQRFDAVNQRFDHLDRDVQAIARVVFPRD